MSAPLMILCSAGSRPVTAQQAPPTAAAEPMLLEEIIVVAEKQASGRPLQNVPIAVTGVEEVTMQEEHITNIVDLGHMAPDVVLDTSGTLFGTAAFTIRGVGARTSTPSIDPAVSVTQDGMPLTLQTGLSLMGTFDTQSVEILRGPQGVLQGVGAAGGSVTFQTPLPSQTFHATGSISAGNFNMIGSTATVEGPLSGDFFGKVAVFEQHVDGYYENTTDEGKYVAAPGNPSGLEPQHATGLVSGTQTVVVKPTFLWQPSDDLKIKLFAQFEDDIDGGSAPLQVQEPQNGGPPYKYQTVWGYTPTPEPYQTNMATPGFTHIQEEHLIGEADYSIANGVWTTIAAIRNVNFDALYDNNGTPFNILLVTQKEENRQANIESRFSANVSDRISYLVGTYLFDDNLPVTVVNGTNVAELGKPLVDKADPNSLTNLDNQLIQYNQKTKIAALFGNVDYKILSDLTLSAGLRYQYENKNLDIQPGAGPTAVIFCTVGTLNGCPTTYYDPQKTWYTATPRGVLAWQITPDVMTYASYSKGFGAGNFNGSPSTLAAAITPANPETVDSYEVGLKSEWFDHRFRANLAVYDENFDNIQRTAITSNGGQHVSTLLNAATAKIKGAEAELTALPFEGMRIFANGGFVNAVYDSFNPTLQLPSAPYNPNELPTELGFANLPRWTTDGGYTYTFTLPHSDGNFEINTDYSWRSKQWGDFANSPQDIIHAYGLLNASINHTSGPWTVSLWGRNLKNTVYYEAGAIGAGFQLFPGIPRTFGITATLKVY